MTCDGTTARLYVDGNLEVTQIKTYQTTSTGTAFIGASVGSSEYFPGLVDEVSLYNRALTAPEVQAIYQAGNGGKCTTHP